MAVVCPTEEQKMMKENKSFCLAIYARILSFFLLDLKRRKLVSLVGFEVKKIHVFCFAGFEVKKISSLASVKKDHAGVSSMSDDL